MKCIFKKRVVNYYLQIIFDFMKIECKKNSNFETREEFRF